VPGLALVRVYEDIEAKKRDTVHIILEEKRERGEHTAGCECPLSGAPSAKQ